MDLRERAGVLDRHEHLDAVIEVALHEIRAADVRRDALVGLERVDPAVLEEATDDRADVDVLGHALDARPKRAGGARDDVDLRSGSRRGVELLDDLRIDEVVELQPDACVLPAGRGGDRANLVDKSAAQREGRHEELAELLRATEPRDVVEEIGNVRGDLLVGREDPRSS